MSRPTLVVLAVGVLVAIGFAFATAVLRSPASATAVAAAPAASGPVYPGQAPLPSTTSAAAGSVPASPSPPALAPNTGAPAPFVQSFAGQPEIPPAANLPSPSAPHAMPANADGCDHNYGSVTQCVPWTFPGGTADKCAWLHAHGFAGLKVVGTDRQSLDQDGDGVACNT